jgi:hypothetical protein
MWRVAGDYFLKWGFFPSAHLVVFHRYTALFAFCGHRNASHEVSRIRLKLKRVTILRSVGI